MRINSIDNKYNKSVYGLTFGIKSLTEPNKQVFDAVKVLGKIFELPFEQRSKHLIHESRDGIINSAKFYMNTKDGTKITVLRSMTRGMKQAVKYFAVKFENGDFQENFQINSDNGLVLKPIVNMKSKFGTDVLYYSKKQVDESLLPFLLEKYLPEISQNVREGNNLTKIEAKNELLKTDASVKNPEDENVKPKAFMHKVYIKKGFRSVEQLQADEKIKIIDNKAEVKEMIDIYERFLQLTESMNKFERIDLIDNTFKGLLERRKGLRGMFIKNIDEGISARIMFVPNQDIFRIFLVDDNYEVKKSYLIKNGENVAYNYYVSSTGVLPRVLRYCTEKDFSIKHPDYKSDMKKIYQKMKEIENILDNL